MGGNGTTQQIVKLLSPDMFLQQAHTHAHHHKHLTTCTDYYTTHTTIAHQ